MDNNEIIFKYIFPEDYEPEYVNGTFVTIGSSDELIMNFFMDRPPMPYEQRFTVKDDGSLGNAGEVISPKHFKMRRNVKTGIVVSKDTALSIYHWLRDQLIEMGVEKDDLE